uniref:Putative dna topoisomerase i-interacting protein n=1 Tax=Tabanus bromius TaxID=304241 RepID=A0A0K8TTM2_TABBR
MSTFLADIDVTCATLGYFDGQNYFENADVLQNLKHLLWILHNDNYNHDFLRHVAKINVLHTDLIPLLCKNPDDEVFQALIRLLILLTNPIAILYREGIPKDGVHRSVFLEIVDFMTKYKEAFVADSPWVNLALKLRKSLETEGIFRGEEADMLIERILVLTRNVLQIPTNISKELNAENGPTTHDRVVWVLLQSGMLDLILYILNSADDHRFHLHALEIVVLVLKEQTAPSLACISMQRSTPDKSRNEEELVAIRCEEKEKMKLNPRSVRHPRFGGTYVFQNMKSVSENDMIFHKPLEYSTIANFDGDKTKRKNTHRVVEEIFQNEHCSAFSIRLLLREFCTEILRSAYNTLVRKIRNLLERNTARRNNDDSYLLWTITFFMEFNRLSGLPFELVSESMSVQCFHWVLTEMQHHMDMMETDKEQERIWAKRLNVAVRAFKQMILSMIALPKLKVEKAVSLFHILLNNVCGTTEYRECLLQLLLLYKATRTTKIFLQDVIETTYYFIKILKSSKPSELATNDAKLQPMERRRNEPIDKLWSAIEPTISNLLEFTSEEECARIAKVFDKEFDQKGDKCIMKIHSLLHQGNYEEAIAVSRAARLVWPENKYFCTRHSSAQDELALLRNIFASSPRAGRGSHMERTSIIEEYLKRFVNPKVVRTCIIVLSDWKQIKTVVLKSAVALLHSIATISNCPTILYQASLFRIFQQAFHTKRNEHNLELQRLGIFTVRSFIQSAKINPKIYGELFFYKTISHCSNVENVYSGVNPKTMWATSEETELHKLFERNQTNPQSGQDVVEWLTHNLSDKPKNRCAVTGKLTDTDLSFRKSESKFTTTISNFWTVEEDEELISLYKEHKTARENFSITTQRFKGLKSMDDIIKRMIFLKLISGRSAVTPEKETYEMSEKQAELLCIVNKKFEDVMEWLKESFIDALNSLCESEDGIPLVPVNKIHSAALVDEDFRSLLLSFGLQPPSNNERFWRFPHVNSYEFEVIIKFIEKSNLTCQRSILEMKKETCNEPNESKNEVSNSFQKNNEHLAHSENYRLKNAVDYNSVKRSGTKRPLHFESDDSTYEKKTRHKEEKITTSDFIAS